MSMSAKRCEERKEEKYKMKYKKLKKIIKNYVFENAAFCDQIAQIHENLVIIKEERQFLLKKLMENEDSEIHMLSMTNNNLGGQNLLPVKRGPKKRLNSDNKNKSDNINSKSSPSLTQLKKEINLNINDISSGRSTFPIVLRNLTIHSLGEILPNNRFFCTDHWIYPVGYTATRIYSHPREPERKCTFTCKILDNFGVPQFQIIPDSDYDHVFFGDSANKCHLDLLETIIESANIKNLPLTTHGEIFFGLGHKVVKALLQSLSNFKKCQHFKGFLPDLTIDQEDKDPTLNFDAMQRLLAISVYHTVPEVKAEPPDELLD